MGEEIFNPKGIPFVYEKGLNKLQSMKNCMKTQQLTYYFESVMTRRGHQQAVSSIENMHYKTQQKAETIVSSSKFDTVFLRPMI